MKKATYFLKQLDIHRLPGFPRGLDSLKLARNINIICGPNASGKSSTARVMQQLIWPANTSGVEASAQVEIEDENWRIDLNSHSTRTQRNGLDASMGGLPPVQGCHRYLLPLHDLIKENETDLAKEILKESIGGYDLGAAGKNLNYSTHVPTRTRRYNPYIEAENHYQEVLASQRELKKEEAQLQELYQQKEEALLAGKKKDLYQRYASFLAEKNRLKHLLLQKEAFPSSISLCNGDELQLLDELETQIEETLTAVAKVSAKVQQAESLLKGLNISTDNIEEEDSIHLQERLRKLENLGRSIEELESRIETQQELTRLAARAIDPDMNPEAWGSLDLKTVGDLNEFLQQANKTLGHRDLLAIEEEKLSGDLEQLENINGSEEILEGIRILSSWLKEQSKQPGVPQWLVIAMALTGALSAIATYFTIWGFLGLPLLGLFIFLAFRNSYESSSRVREKDFAQLKLASPAAWTTDAVTDRLEQLITELRQALLQQKLITDLDTCRSKLRAIQPSIDNLTEKAENWRKKQGSVPAYSSDFSSLSWFLIHAAKWQEAFTAGQAFKADKAEKHKKYLRELDLVNSLFEKYRLAPASDETEAAAKLQELQRQLHLHQEQKTVLKAEKEKYTDQKAQETKLREKLTAIYQNLQLPLDDRHGLKQLVDRLSGYKDLCTKIEAAQLNLGEKQQLLREHPLFYSKEEDLTLEQVQEKIEIYSARAADLETISEKITRINTLVEEKQRGHEMEEVLSSKQQALEALEEQYQETLASRTGHIVLEQLKKATQEQNRPAVFIRANELLGIITHGRYEIRIEGQENPRFKAFDTRTGDGLSLSQISTGTRVQFLLAIRLAYVESQETGVKLPIFADELLANSDDLRATAIIEALIAISKQGRQIFYFTAQEDEVHKWRSHLQQHPGLENSVISLQPGTKAPTYLEQRTEKVRFIQEVPDPGSMTHYEYGQKLQVPPFDLLTEDCSSLHLWYLLENNELLYYCLKYKIECWGQLESYRKHNPSFGNFDEKEWKQVRERIRLLQRLKQLHRQGRGLPIDREVLKSSGAITERYLDTVNEKLLELKGDPKALIAAMLAGEIKIHNLHKRTRDLEEYLITNNYLDQQEPLDENSFTLKLREYTEALKMPLEEGESFCNRILITHRSKGDPLSFSEN